MNLVLRQDQALRRALFALALVLLVASVIAVALAASFTERAARADRDLRLRRDALAIEAALARLTADLRLLSRQPALTGLLEPVDDPARARFLRLEAEGTSMEVLEKHPEVAGLELEGPDKPSRLRLARRDGAPIRLRPEAGLPSGTQMQFPVGPGVEPLGHLRALVSLPDLVDVALPGRRRELELSLAAASGEKLAISNDVALELALTAHPEASDLEVALRRLPWLLLGLQATILAAAGIVITLALRQARRAAALSADRRLAERQRELERQLFHRERLASLGRVAAGVAHEINNPLEGMTNHLKMAAEDATSDDVRHHVELAAQGVRRIAGIVRTMLDFASPGPAAPVPFQLYDAAREAIELVRPVAGFRDLRIALVGDVGPVRGHAAAMTQVFLNLLLNARDAGAAAVEVSIRRERGEVIARVADDGPGFSAEAAARAFEPFSSTRGSTGLGLAICHAIVAEHGGRIGLQPQAALGAAIELVLPEAGA